jgi:hypothetical protein
MSAGQTVAEQWEAQLRAVRARVEQGGGRPGVVPAQEARGMTGLAIMQALLEGRFPYAPSPRRSTSSSSKWTRARPRSRARRRRST